MIGSFIQKGATAAILMWINGQFARYGKALKLEIDRSGKTIYDEVLPKGETTPMTVTAGYQVCRENGRHTLRFSNINTSREWVNVLLKESNRAEVVIPVPAEYGGLLDVLL